MKNDKTSTTKKPAAKAKKPATAKPAPKKTDKVDKLPKTKNKKENFDSDDLMNLDGSRSLISKILLGLVLFVLTFFFARTAIWEYKYYREMEGKPRVAAETVEEPAEVEETEVTAEQRSEHVVPADAPRYLSIEKLGIVNARIFSMGINKSGELDTPANIFDVGWYSQSSKPGSGGVLVMDGHNGGPNVEGVFKHLNTLYEGDLIVIERGDGEKFTYKVVENKEVALSEADNYMKTAFTTPVQGTEALTLISCIGEWSQVQQTYLSRQFTRAILIQN